MRSTNIETYQRIKADRLLSNTYWDVYDLLFREGPLTGKELDKKLGTDSAHKRLSELRVRGVVACKTCPTSGGVAVVEWDVTDALPSQRRRAKKQPRPTAVDLNKAVEDLRELWRVAQAAGYQPSDALGRIGEWLASGAPG